MAVSQKRRLIIGAGPKKLTAAGIYRNIKIFSYLCGIFVFAIGVYIAYKFAGLNNTAVLIFGVGFLFLGFGVAKLAFKVGINRARKKYRALLNDFVVVKWGKKKVAGFSLLTILSSVILFIVFVIVVVPGIDVVKADSMILGAHRGDSVRYIENTLPAFESAIRDDKYKFVEFDIQYTQDKVLVVHHDKSLFRLQKKLTYLEDVTYEELLGVSDYYIPTYEEVMKIVAGKKSLNIEIKSQGYLEDDEEIVDFVIGDLEARGILNTTLIVSVSSDVIRYVSDNYPDVKTGKVYWVDYSTFLNFDSVAEGMFEKMEEDGSDYLMLHGSNLWNYDMLKRVKPANKTIIIWYFTDEMYIIPNDIDEMTDNSGTILGYSVKELEPSESWVLTIGGKRLVGSKKFCWLGVC